VTHYKSLVDSTWLGQWDLPGRDVIVTIAKVAKYRPERVQSKRMPDGSYQPEPNKKLAISFVGKKKAWLAGPVSLKAIAAMFGPEIEAWEGRAVALYVDADVAFGGQVVGGIRVRPTPPKSSAKPSTDPLDRPVDQVKAEQIDRAAGRIPGENDDDDQQD
jgi:hypothetical protein